MIAGTSPPALAKSMFTDSTCLPPKTKFPKSIARKTKNPLGLFAPAGR
jgi:hypothetical protein